MKRIIIICEGETEREFCYDVLESHFSARNIQIHPPLIKKSPGGIVPWESLKKQIENHLKQDGSAFVTTLIDYYGIPERCNFPEWESAHTIQDKNQRMSKLEEGMKQSLYDKIQFRFIPYIQLHEFEGLLLNTMDVFTNQIPQGDIISEFRLNKIIDDNTNPEMINTDNPPSYQLQKLIKGYNKIVYGAILAQSIGLERIRSKSPRFNEWITKLENV